ncbi:MAG: hypothetical protein AB8B83_04685, partial [Bdellovibrionales bacterium]
MDEVKKQPEQKPHIVRDVLHVVLELSATVLLFVVLAIGVLIWRLNAGPIDIAFAKETIKDALKDQQSGTYVDFDKAVLQWPDLRGPLLLGLNDGRVLSDDGTLIVAIDSAAISLNKGKLLLGQVAPEGLILRKPSLLVYRLEDNSFTIGLGDFDMASAESGAQSANVTLNDILDVFRQGQDGREGDLAKLDLFRIEDARVLIDDRVLSRSWQVPRFQISLERETSGMRVAFDVDLPRLSETPEDIIPNIEGDLFAGWEAETFQIDAVLSHFNTRFLSDKIPNLQELERHRVQFDATAKATLDSDFTLKSAEVILFSDDGALQLDDFSDEPLLYDDFGVKALYDAENDILKLEALKATVGDITLKGGVNIAHDKRGFDKGFAAVGRLDIDAMKHEHLVPLWPAALEDDKSKEWVIDKILDGDFRDLFTTFEVIGLPDQNKEMSIDLKELKAGFDFENLDVKYKTTMAPAMNGVGKAAFDYKSATIRIDLDSAKILDMDVPRGRLLFSNIIVKDAGQADLDMDVKGPFQSMLTYLSDEPIGLELDGDINDVRGNIDTTVRLKFPTRDDVLKEDVDIDIDATVTDIYLPQIVRDLALSGGPYDLSVKDGVFGLEGSGALDGRAIELNYQEYLFAEDKPFKSKTKAKMTADQALRETLGIALDDYLTGPADIDVTYTSYNDGKAVAEVDADITASTYFLDPFDYLKPAGRAGEASLKAVFENENLVKITDFTVKAPNVALSPSTLIFKNFGDETRVSGGRLNKMVVEKTNGDIEFEITDAGVLNLLMNASFLDMRPFLNRDREAPKDNDNGAMRISVSAERAQASDDGIVSQVKVFSDMNDQGRFNQLEFDAVAGSGSVYLRFKPDVNGKRTFRLEADDAGAFLKAFELYQNVRGGSLIVHGEPIRGYADRDLLGKAQMSDFKVVKAPGLAQLISAMSLNGPAEMLSGEGLGFEKLEADFEWISKPENSVLQVKNGRTSGNSLGLTFEGSYESGTMGVDLSGTIIPLSGLNNMLKDIPLVGNILGGTSGLFAATYTMKGEGKDAQVTVNPLSVLAPGILRSILFEGGSLDTD